jgi:hypothetical protein
MEFYPGAFLGTVELSPFFLVNLRECIPARQPTRSLGDLQEKPPRTRERLMRAPWRPGLPARSVPTTRNEEPTDSHSSKGAFLVWPPSDGGVGVAFKSPVFAQRLPVESGSRSRPRLLPGLCRRHPSSGCPGGWPAPDVPRRWWGAVRRPRNRPRSQDPASGRQFRCAATTYNAYIPLDAQLNHALWSQNPQGFLDA